jgi:hypothetical protein
LICLTGGERRRRKQTGKAKDGQADNKLLFHLNLHFVVDSFLKRALRGWNYSRFSAPKQPSLSCLQRDAVVYCSAKEIKGNCDLPMRRFLAKE